MSQIPGGAFGYHQYYKNVLVDEETLASKQISDEGSQQSTVASLRKEESRYDYDQNSILADNSRDGTLDNHSIYTDYSGTDYTCSIKNKYSRSFDGCSTVISETTGTQCEKESRQCAVTIDSETTKESASYQVSGSVTIEQTIGSDEQSDHDVLHYRISRGEWKEVGKILATPQGKVMASNPHPNGHGDYPLHLILDYQVNFEARAKLMEVYRKEQNRLEIKLAAREDRERRRKEGEDVDTVYDSDEWTSSGSEDESDDDDEKAGDSVEKSMPPASLVLAVIKACPSACKVQGYNGRYPLHHATRMHHPKEVIDAIIRQYPQALNMQDNQEKTPRDYEERSSKGSYDLLDINAMLDRPASCWLQNIRDEELGNNLNNELNALEKEVGDLMIEYEKVMSDERDLLERMAEIDRVVVSYNEFRENQDLNGRVAKLQNSLETELFRVKDKLDSLVGQAELKYADDEKERKYIAGFNEDVIKIYENAQDEINELKEEISNLKLCASSK